MTLALWYRVINRARAFQVRPRSGWALAWNLKILWLQAGRALEQNRDFIE